MNVHEQPYSERVWLNKLGSSSTGSVVTYHGPSYWSTEECPLSTRIEIADCHGKVRLHKTDADTMDEFINKLKLLSMVINNFIAHLEDGKCDD